MFIFDKIQAGSFQAKKAIVPSRAIKLDFTFSRLLKNYVFAVTAGKVKTQDPEMVKAELASDIKQLDEEIAQAKALVAASQH